ncbi:hypothetical protein KQX54_000489, partial [Cotesia glomerata]
MAEMRIIEDYSVWFALINESGEQELNEVLYLYVQTSEVQFLSKQQWESIDDEVEIIEDFNESDSTDNETPSLLKLSTSGLSSRSSSSVRLTPSPHPTESWHHHRQCK